MTRAAKKKRSRLRRLARAVLGVLALIALLAAPPLAMERLRKMPPGTDVRSPPCPLSPGHTRLLVDSTAYDTNRNERVFQHEIFDAGLKMIREARQFIYIDFFLWNDWQGAVAERHRALASELAAALIRKKKEAPGITILVLTDPINESYGGEPPAALRDVAAAGIPVVFTDLARLRDSNPIYSGPATFYGGLLARLGPVARWLDQPRFNNPLRRNTDPIPARQMARMFHFKANHRKVIVADGPDGEWRVLATSFNPADGSSAHSNIGLLIDGGLAAEALRTELDCVEWSAACPGHVLGADTNAIRDTLAVLRVRLSGRTAAKTPDNTGPAATWLSEDSIRRQILSMLDEAGPGDDVRIALFYLSDFEVVRSICDAAQAGATVRVILDPNRDAFGRIKNGVPNRPVAAELVAFAQSRQVALSVRWADTHGEQFHTKAMSIAHAADGKYQFLCGSANWTRRNLQNLNLEACVFVERDPGIVTAFNDFFDRAWSNSDGLSRTVPYGTFAETGWALRWKRFLYRIQEPTGLSTF